MNDMMIVVAAVVGLSVLGVVLYVQWFTRRVVTTDTPRVQVTLRRTPYVDAATEMVTLTLRATPRRFALTCIQVDRETESRLKVSPPEGFRVESDSSTTPDEIEWVPEKQFILRPNEPVELAIGVANPEKGQGRLLCRAEARLGLGGTGLMFSVPVGCRRIREIDAINLRSELMARATELGIVPAELPEWKRLVELEKSNDAPI